MQRRDAPTPNATPPTNRARPTPPPGQDTDELVRRLADPIGRRLAPQIRHETDADLADLAQRLAEPLHRELRRFEPSPDEQAERLAEPIGRRLRAELRHGHDRIGRPQPRR